VEYRPLGWRDPEWYAYGVKDGVTWMTQKFASWFATAWLYLILWGVVLGAFTVLLYIDGKFSRGLAEGVEDIDPLSFQAMGWVYRFFAASFLMAATRCSIKGIKGKWTFRFLGAFASVIVCLHAFGFGFEALDHRRDQAMAAKEIASVEVDNTADIIADLEAQKLEIDTDTDKAVAALNAEIRQYITDGLNNDHLADSSRERRDALQDEARDQKAALDAHILELKQGRVEAQTKAKQAEVEAEPWAPLFVGMAQLASWSKEPNDWTIYLCAIGFVVFWVLLGESLVICIPERIYLMHLRDAELSKRSEAAKKGHETRKKAVDPDHSIVPMVKDEGYWEERIRKALGTKMKRPTAEGMKDTYFSGLASVHELRGHLSLRVRKGLLSQDDFDFIMREGAYAPEPQMTNGHDKGDDNDDSDDMLPAAPAT
jgi:hypothetical protein